MNIRVKHRVLIADDDERYLSTVKRVVEGEGLETEVAGCGLDALEIVKRVPVSLSILDVQMPDISGLETYRRIRMVRWALPCIFLTGSLSEEVRREALSTGAFTILEKTVDLSVFRTTVLEAIANSIQ